VSTGHLSGTPAFTDYSGVAEAMPMTPIAVALRSLTAESRGSPTTAVTTAEPSAAFASRMLASTLAFGANENTDTVPTSRYLPRTRFA
jgi:hypothetical protein